jgi:hypothetical protein
LLRQTFTALQVCQGFLEQYHTLAAVAFWHALDISPMDLRVRLEMPAHLLAERLGPVIQGSESSAARILIMVFFHLHFFPTDSMGFAVTLTQNFYNNMKNIFNIQGDIVPFREFFVCAEANRSTIKTCFIRKLIK